MRAPRQMAESSAGIGAHCLIRDKQRGRDFFISCFFVYHGCFPDLGHMLQFCQKICLVSLPCKLLHLSSKCNQGWCATFSKQIFPSCRERRAALLCKTMPSYTPLLLPVLWCHGKKNGGGILPMGVLIAVYSPTTVSSHPENCLWVSGCCDTPFRPSSSSLPRLPCHRSHSPRVRLYQWGACRASADQSVWEEREKGWMDKAGLSSSSCDHIRLSLRGSSKQGKAPEWKGGSDVKQLAPH